MSTAVRESSCDGVSFRFELFPKVGPQTAGKTFVKMEELEYHEVLKNLVFLGDAASKKSEIIAFPMVGMRANTLNTAGGVETTKDLATFDDYMVFDAGKGADGKPKFTYETANKIFHKFFEFYADAMATAPAEVLAQINNGEMDARITIAGRDIWTIRNKNFKTDYEADKNHPGVYHVKPGTGRLCDPILEDRNMPVQWEGGFNARAGGRYAVRFSDVPVLVEALKSIEDGKCSIREALYDSKGNAKFDIYGMDPKFYEDNYEKTNLPKEAADAIDSYRQVCSNLHRPKSGHEEKKTCDLT